MSIRTASARLSDMELVELSRNGDHGAFAEIVRRNKPSIASTVYGMIGRCDEAEDIGQEVFIRFYKTIGNFRGDSALSTYLTRIAINLSLNEIKRRKIKRFLSFEKLAEDGIELPYTGSGLMADDNKESVQKAIGSLSPKDRSVIVLRLVDGYSTEETAKILQVPAGTVLSRLSRAQVKLKSILKTYIPEL